MPTLLVRKRSTTACCAMFLFEVSSKHYQTLVAEPVVVLPPEHVRHLQALDTSHTTTEKKDTRKIYQGCVCADSLCRGLGVRCIHEFDG